MLRFRVCVLSWALSCLAAAPHALADDSPSASTGAPAASADVAQVCRDARTAPVDRRVYPQADLNAIVWAQTSVEYRAVTLGTYRAAALSLQSLLKERKPPAPAALEQTGGVDSKAPWAVILDIDETLLDNLPYQGRLFEEARNYDAKLWDCWSAQRSAALIAGAADFFKILASPAAVKRNVRAILITNRVCAARGAEPCPQKAETLEILNHHLLATGYAVRPDELLMKNDPDPNGGAPRWTSDEKSERRSFVASTRRIVMLVGDDFGDFYPNARTLSVEDRLSAMNSQPVAEWWGRRWFALPNPMYGSWERALRNVPAGTPERSKHKEVRAFAYPEAAQ